ncbi:uncharacterized protein zgc:175136 [Rhinichthys klamathensis goyatoka]|uniref:uncharacterized protein zgc:175136 n=1 Tax=Rhinichthys klamathensis goyatoka TaxID=3034132 RepID=UPI0024B50666|nr:uncharacterized protein zgc:175136 [Rhinichthys klamathensis goyatoka]
MGSRYCLRILFALFPACVTCLGNYEGSMPTANVQRVSTRIFPVIVPEVKQMGSRNDPAYSSVHLPHHQGAHGSYNYHKGRLVAGSNIRSDSKDCQTPAKSDNQENMINFKPSASVPKYDWSGFGQPSVQYGSRTATDAFKNVQPSGRLASTSYQGGSTLMKTLKVPEPKPLKPSRGESSYTRTSGSSRIFVVNAHKNAFGHEFNSEVTRDPNHGLTSSSSQMSPQHSSSKGRQSTNKVQTASSSYGPLLKGTPVYSSINPRKLSSSGIQYSELESSVVSSGPVFVVQSGGSAQGRGRLDSVPSHVDPYQSSQTSRDLTASSQGKSWNEPLHYSMSGTPYSPSPALRKPSKNDCRDNVDKSPITSSGEVVLSPPESAHRNKLPPHYEATLPKFQQTYNFHAQPSQNYKPMYPSQSRAQHNVSKSSIASSGAIRIMQGPTNVQSTPESKKPKVHPSFSFSSVKGTSYKPNSRPSKPSRSELGFSATNPNIAGANKINTVRVRLNKPPTSSFGNFQNQRASGGISSGAFQSSFPPCSMGQRPGQNVHTPIGSSAPRYHGSKGVQSQFTVSQGNTDYTRHITAIPSEFDQGSIRRILPILSSNYRQAEQNQPQVNRLESTAPKCEVTQNSPAGLGQEDLVKFQDVNLSI